MASPKLIEFVEGDPGARRRGSPSVKFIKFITVNALTRGSGRQSRSFIISLVFE